MEAGKQAEAVIDGSKLSQTEAALYLSEMSMVLGQLSRSLTFAQESTALAAQCDGAEFWRVSAQAQEAAVLHELGKSSADAAMAFERALRMKRKWRPDYAQLSSLAGFHYLKFALDQIQAAAAGWEALPEEMFTALNVPPARPGATKQRTLLDRIEALRRQAEKTLEDTLMLSAEDDKDWISKFPRRDGLLYRLILGRSWLLDYALRCPTQPESATESLVHASKHLVPGVNGLRESGIRQLLPLGLFWRAALHRKRHDLDHAEDDLAEAMQIAVQGQMELYKLEGHLEYVRLHLARNDVAHARKNLADASAIVTATGSHRRDPEVQSLEASCARSPA